MPDFDGNIDPQPAVYAEIPKLSTDAVALGGTDGAMNAQAIAIAKRFEAIKTAGDGLGSSLVGFIQQGIGAVVRTVQDKLRENVNVDDFGAAGDGVTDDTVNIQKAADSFGAAGGVLNFSAKSYALSELILPSNVSIRFHKTELIQIGAASALISATGSASSAIALTSDAGKGASVLQLVSTAGLAADDYIQVYDNYSYAATDSTYKSGETARIKSVDSGVQVTLHSPLYGSAFAGLLYTTGNSASIRKITPTLRNNISGSVSATGDITTTTHLLHITYGLNFNINGFDTKKSGGIGILLRHCINADVIVSKAQDLLDDIGGGHPGYAVALYGTCHNIKVQGNGWENCRHGFTTGGTSLGYPHAITVSGNKANGCLAGIDTHAAGDDILITGNTSSRNRGSAITVRSKGTSVTNNTIDGAVIHGIALGEDMVSDVIVRDNDISNANTHGITSSVSCRNLTIADNDILDAGIDGISLFSSGTYDSVGLVILDNVIKGAGRLSASRAGIITTGSFTTTGAIIKGNIINATNALSYAIRTLGLTGSWVSDNNARGAFSVSPFDLGTNFAPRNDKVDAVNFLRIDSTPTQIPQIIAAGQDSIIDVGLTPKGSTGRVRFGTNVANADAPIIGYIEIKDSSGTVRKLAVIA